MLPSLAPGVHRLNLLERPTGLTCGLLKPNPGRDGPNNGRAVGGAEEGGRRGEGAKEELERAMGSQEEGWNKKSRIYQSGTRSLD